MDKTKGKDLHKAVRNRGMVLIAIGTAVMGLAVFFLLHIYQNKNEEIFRTLIEENLTSTHQGQASDIRGIIRETGGCWRSWPTCTQIRRRAEEAVPIWRPYGNWNICMRLIITRRRGCRRR